MSTFSGIRPATLTARGGREPVDEIETLADPWARSVSDLTKALRVDPVAGLSRSEVSRRLMRFGANVLRQIRRRSIWAILVAQFASLLVALLAAAVVAAMAFGEWVEAGASLGTRDAPHGSPQCLGEPPFSRRDLGCDQRDMYGQDRHAHREPYSGGSLPARFGSGIKAPCPGNRGALQQRRALRQRGRRWRSLGSGALGPGPPGRHRKSRAFESLARTKGGGV